MKYTIVKNGSTYFGRIEQPETQNEEAYIARWLEKFPEDSREDVISFISKGRTVFESFIKRGENVEGIECKTNFSIKGNFDDYEDVFNKKHQTLQVNATLRSFAKANLDHIHLEKMEPRKQGPDFEVVCDKTHIDLPENIIVKGGFARAVGSDMTVSDNGSGSNDQGVTLISTTGERFACETILVNTAKQIMFQLNPAALPGEYDIEIATYQHGKHVAKSIIRSLCKKRIKVIEEPIQE